jgi:hypothetical protein
MDIREQVVKINLNAILTDGAPVSTEMNLKVL